MKCTPWKKRLALYGLAATLVTTVVLWLLTNILVFMATEIPPSARPALSSQFLQYPATKESVQSFDGKKISFWFFPQTNDPAKPTLIIIHGFGASKDHMLTYLLFAQQNGYSVAALDLRGHGDSDPGLCSFGYNEKQDVLALMNDLKRRGKSRFVLWGTSMGAVTSALAAETRPEGLAGLILDAPFDTLRNTLAHHARLFFNLPEFPLLPITYWRMEGRVGYDTKAIDVPRALKPVHVPILFLAAEKDTRMTLSMVQGIYDGANEPKSIYIMPGATHEYRDFEPEFQARILDFLKTQGL
jgi:pimeloyl-ACP methyl ester carboxylesterase